MNNPYGQVLVEQISGLFIELKIRCSKCQKVGIVEVVLEMLMNTFTANKLPKGWTSSRDYDHRSVFCTDCKEDWER